MPSELQFEFDVFISYSSKDKEWVRGELLKRVEQSGLKAFIDFRDFAPGAPGIKEMERGVLKCRKTLLVLSPDYLSSEWCEIENIMVQAVGAANRELRLIPVLKAECDKPLRIGALTHVDFTDGADRELAWRQLLTALGRPPEPESPRAPKRDNWFLAHPYAMPPNFTGRIDERSMLTVWLNGDPSHPLLVLRALGGFGKSALSWHWLMNDVAPATWPRVIWWSFYESDASFDSFLERSLTYLKAGDPAQLGPRQRVDALVNALHESGTLLILDGFERLLRAFAGSNAAYQGDEAGTSPSDRDCVSAHAEIFLRNLATLPDIRSKVLLTTRLRPAPVETRDGILLHGCREEDLTQLQPADAVEFFRAQGIRGTHTEIESACDPYGYHPLSLRLLAGLIVRDFQQPGDIVAAKRLDVSGDLVQRQHHVLETAYESLSPGRRELLGRIACFRSPVSYDALKALASEKQPLDADLHDLVARGLLHHDRKESRFDLHPIVRRYAYDRLTARDRTAAHVRLGDYFAAVPEPDKVTRLEDLVPAIELYHHSVRAGKLDEAFTLFRDRLATPLCYQLGAYQLIIELMLALFLEGEDHPSRLKEKGAQAWTLNELANAYSRSGQPLRAVPLLERQNAIQEKRGNKKNLATGLTNLGNRHRDRGELRAAEADWRRAIALCSEIEEDAGQGGTVLYELGLVLAYRGDWRKCSESLRAAEVVKKRRMHLQAQGVIWAYRAMCELLRLRNNLPTANPQSALGPARRALKLADKTAHTYYPFERDYVRAHWLLGAAHRVASQFAEAERHLNEALERCRRINMVDHEANILIDLARLQAVSAPDEAQRLAEEALVITERSGYVLQGADAHLELAKLALARGDKVTAKVHAQKAKDLATCDGPPDYTYKAAYDEALMLLKQLG